MFSLFSLTSRVDYDMLIRMLALFLSGMFSEPILQCSRFIYHNCIAHKLCFNLFSDKLIFYCSGCLEQWKRGLRSTLQPVLFTLLLPCIYLIEMVACL